MAKSVILCVGCIQVRRRGGGGGGVAVWIMCVVGGKVG